MQAKDAAGAAMRAKGTLDYLLALHMVVRISQNELSGDWLIGQHAEDAVAGEIDAVLDSYLDADPDAQAEGWRLYKSMAEFQRQANLPNGNSLDVNRAWNAAHDRWLALCANHQKFADAFVERTNRRG